jgi:hypothetical protein
MNAGRKNMTCEVSFFELSEYQAGHKSDRLEKHITECEICRRRIATLTQMDQSLRTFDLQKLSDQAALQIRKTLSREIRGSACPEIMTLTDVANFLRLSPTQLEEIIDELPAFELAGQIRVRRTRLIDWIEQRERDFFQTNIESAMAKNVSRFSVKGVA